MPKYCKDILSSETIDQYKLRFQKVQLMHNIICPKRLDMQLLKYANKPIVITTICGLNYYDFLQERIKNVAGYLRKV